MAGKGGEGKRDRGAQLQASSMAHAVSAAVKVESGAIHDAAAE